MIYESTPHNIIGLLSSVECASRDQLVKFFSDASDAPNVEYYLEQLTKNRILNYDEAKKRYSLHNGPMLKEPVIQNRIKAFWVIAAIMSNGITDVSLMPYPSQFMFITVENEVYDLTVCASKTDALVAAKKLRMWQLEGVEDEVNHVLIVDSEDMGRELGEYGFDFYCVIDRNHKPRYFTWN